MSRWYGPPPERCPDCGEEIAWYDLTGGSEEQAGECGCTGMFWKDGKGGVKRVRQVYGYADADLF